MSPSALRALARIGRRNVARHKVRSLLIVLLIGLPVAGMVGGIALLRTTGIPEERWTTARFGSADLLAQGGDVALLRQHLPPVSIIEGYVEGEARLVVPGARPSVRLRAASLDGLARGIVTLVDGRAPNGASEVAISASLGGLLDLAIGEHLTVEELGELTIVGMVENPLYLAERTVLLDPAAYASREGDSGGWLVALPPATDPYAYGGLVEDPSTGAPGMVIEVRGQSGGSFDASPTVLILGGLALVEAALIASAAFAVSIRRRQRELGLLAATGATPRQLATTVLAEALTLGAIACIGGVLAGLAGVLALTPWLDELTQHRNPPVVIDPAGALGPMGIGILATLVAAWIPARTVARLPVLLALSGRRPPHRSASRALWLGIVMVAIGLIATVAGATSSFDGNQDLRQYLILGGAVLGTLGFGSCAPWLLEHLDSIASRLPVAGRLALRDTARARSRNAPIVTAVLAGLAGAIAIGAWAASRDAENLRGWVPMLWPDQVLVSGAGAAEAAREILATPGVSGGGQVAYVVPHVPGRYAFFRFPDARDAQGKLINLGESCENCNPDVIVPYQVSEAAAAAPALLALSHAEEGLADLAAGRAVLLTNRQLTASTLEIAIEGEGAEAAPQRATLPVRVLIRDVAGGILPALFLPDAVVQQLGLVPAATYDDYLATERFVIQYDHEVTPADLEAAQRIAGRYLDTTAETFSAPVRPGEASRILLIVLVVLFSLSVTGVALALGEAESRPDQRTLLALGAEPRLRRRIAAARAAVLTFVAGLLAVPAGLLPIWGIFTSRDEAMEVPGIEIAGALLVLPALAVAFSWLLSRPIPDWNAFRSLETR